MKNSIVLHYNIHKKENVKYIRIREKSVITHLCLYHLFLCIGVTILFVVANGCTPKINKNNTATKIENNLTSPAWVDEYPIVFVGNWDTENPFRSRLGGNPIGWQDNYEKLNTEETVIKLKDMGVTMIITHFFKGFGLEAEKNSIEDTKKFIDLCTKHGLKVGVYVGSTIGYETFLLEKPEAVEWLIPDYLGEPVIYQFARGSQPFRKMVYFMHPGYIEYMKRVLKIAIDELNVDLIHFDNTAGRAVVPTFHHPMAIVDFRKYLVNKYTSEILKKRFGFSDIRYIEPPKITFELAEVSEPYRYYYHRSTIIDPLFQEWMDFRNQQLADFYGIMKNYIRNLNQNVAIDNNPAFGLTGVNEKLIWGIDYPRLLSHTDFIWSEEGNEAAVNDEGVLISKIRTYKMAATLKNRIFTYTATPKLMAESMAYNKQIGMVGRLTVIDDFPEKNRSYIKFFHKNFDYYRNIQNVADVAVLRSYATMAYNNDQPYESTYLFEQTLIQEKIPFDIIFDENLKDISKYKVLVLASQESLSDENMDIIRSFVNNGGGLVATGNTSLFTEWRQRRPDFGLNDLFKIKPGVNIPTQKNQIGKGRVVYIPNVQPLIPKPSAVPMTNEYWKLPVNRDDLVESVKWASDNKLSINIEAPLTVTMELYQKEDQSALILHLINYDSDNSLVNNVTVDMQVPEGRKVAHISLLTPDGRDDEVLPFKNFGKGVVFTVPELSIYNLVVIKLE